MALLVTGGAGFIGSNFILHTLKHHNELIINVDKLTYAGNRSNLASLEDSEKYVFVQADINDVTCVSDLLHRFNCRAVIHFAAESHVDRSISNPEVFVETNVLGTFRLLEAARNYWANLNQSSQKKDFRFVHVSTDEVFGSLKPDAPAFTEENRYEPNSPYSASKAAADHFVRAYYHTYGFPTLTVNCSNNYGPFQFPEKLIPLTLCRALAGLDIPIYGNGQQIRDWLYVEDHCRAINTVLEQGSLGKVYAVGGMNEKTNLEVVHSICDLLDEKSSRSDQRSYREQIAFVADRPGHDVRYAINPNKIGHELGWKPQQSFTSGLEKTINWYLSNLDWVAHLNQRHKKAEMVAA